MCNVATISVEYSIYALPMEEVRSRVMDLERGNLTFNVNSTEWDMKKILTLNHIYGGSAAQAKKNLEPLIGELDRRFKGYCEKDVIILN